MFLKINSPNCFSREYQVGIGQEEKCAIEIFCSFLISSSEFQSYIDKRMCVMSNF